jgi:hypothetical protein
MKSSNEGSAAHHCARGPRGAAKPKAQAIALHDIRGRVQTEYGASLFALNQNLTTTVNASGNTGPRTSFRYGLAAETPLNLISTGYVYFQKNAP